MSQKGYILNKVLWGFLLGLVIVAGWLFYPDISNLYNSSAPRIANKIAAVKENVVRKKLPVSQKKDEPPPIDNSGKKASNSDVAVEAAPELKNEPKAVTEKVAHNPVSLKETARAAVKPYYAEEESLWQDLIKRPLNPEYINNYPHGECFNRVASGSNLPLPLVLGLAGYLSNFEPESSIDDRFGIMRLGWPNPTRKMGVQKKEELLNDPCRNIELAGRLFSDLLSKSGGEWVPALVAYRDQVEAVHPEKIRKTDLLFSSRLRKHVEKVIEMPFEKITMYAFWSFDERMTAEEFVESIEKHSGIDLWLGQEGHRYVVFIPSANEGEKREKTDLIKKEAGISGM